MVPPCGRLLMETGSGDEGLDLFQGVGQRGVEAIVERFSQYDTGRIATLIGQATERNPPRSRAPSNASTEPLR